MLTLSAGRTTVTVDPGRGARLTSLQFDETELLAGGADPLTSGCYPMVPWCGRIRDARFPWRGVTRALAATDGGHALHGLVHSSPWNVVDIGPGRVTMDTIIDVDGWLSRTSVTHTISVDNDVVRCEMRLESTDGEFPAQLGWHPCFAGATSFESSFRTMYLREADGITDGRRVESRPGPWDDCFTDLVSNPVVRWGSCAAEMSSDCSHWVVYDEVPGLVCIEPQSGPPNAFNHTPDTGDVAGLDVVIPGRPLARWMEIRLSDTT